MPDHRTDARVELVPREDAERIVAFRDRALLARAAYDREAFPDPAVHTNGQSVLDLSSGGVQASAYVEGHAEDPRYGHLLPLAECEAGHKGRFREEESVRFFGHSRGSTVDVAARLDAVHGGAQRALAWRFGLPRSRRARHESRKRKGDA